MTAKAVVATKRAEARSRYFTREEAKRLGWNVDHPNNGGQFLEEQEVVDFFPELSATLGQDKPDFVALGEDDKACLVIECKSDAKALDKGIQEAIDYTESINACRGFDVRLAACVAGSPDRRIFIRTSFRLDDKWVALTSFGFPLTQLPTPREVTIALEQGDGTTDVQLPDESKFFDAAISLSNILRQAKVEESKRPGVIGSIILALYQGDFSLSPSVVLKQINANLEAAIDSFPDIPDRPRRRMIEAFKLGAESENLRSKIEQVVQHLERLNIRSIMRSSVDFLGQFYETFLRYGCNTKNMGIVFTPRHITRFCADLIKVDLQHNVYDPACGTGGFLVAAFDRMLLQADSDAARQKARSSLFGRDTNSTVWALSMLNMLFRGDGKSHIEFRSAFDKPFQEDRFQRVLMNPPFSQEGEPEVDFIDHALKSLSPSGIAAIVLKANVMIDPDLSYWRRELVSNHHVMAVISLPPDLFYPVGVSTVILVIQAHVRNADKKTFLAIVKNDGFEISKSRRVGRSGSQLPEILFLFNKHLDGAHVDTIPGFVGVIDRRSIVKGEEICAERWLPSEPFTLADYAQHRSASFQQIALAIANHPEIVDATIPNYEQHILPVIQPPSTTGSLGNWFDIRSGDSIGFKTYPGGSVPYISSGDAFNSVVALVEPPIAEQYVSPHITITAFGQAALQPWKFCARGNGGSAVRVLRPLCRMNVAEMLWFIGQINAQRWRFHYGRMAARHRLMTLS